MSSISELIPSNFDGNEAWAYCPTRNDRVGQIFDFRALRSVENKELVEDLVSMVNAAWGKSRITSPEEMGIRLSNLPFFPASFHGSDIANFLETRGVRLSEDFLDEIERYNPVDVGNPMVAIKKRAMQVCQYLKRDFNKLTDFGTWNSERKFQFDIGIKKNIEVFPNVLMLVDVQGFPNRDGNASALIQYALATLRGQYGLAVPEYLKKIRYVVTFTPGINEVADARAKKLHESQGAFQVDIYWDGARPNMENHGITPFCYKAGEFIAKPNSRINFNKGISDAASFI